MNDKALDVAQETIFRFNSGQYDVRDRDLLAALATAAVVQAVQLERIANALCQLDRRFAVR